MSFVGIRVAITKGWRKLGKKLIGSCIGIVRDNGMEPRLQKELRESGLPERYEDIPSDDDTDVSDAQMDDLPEGSNPQYNADYSGSQYDREYYTSTDLGGPSYSHQVMLFSNLRE